MIGQFVGVVGFNFFRYAKSTRVEMPASWTSISRRQRDLIGPKGYSFAASPLLYPIMSQKIDLIFSTNNAIVEG